MHQKSRFGQWGESVALRFLRAKGFVLIERNVRTPHGEIDLVVLDETELVFVEVKTRRTQHFGTPEESVNTKKLLNLSNAIAYYIEIHAWTGPYRLDVISIMTQKTSARILHLQNVG